MTDFYRSDRFRAELAAGHRWQELAAAYFRARGLPVLATPPEIDPEHPERFANEVDLRVAGQRVEVKSRRETFTGARDYPYPTAYIDTLSKLRRHREAGLTPRLYVLISRATGCMVAADPMGTGHRWERVTRMDRVRGHEDTWVAAPLDCLMSMDVAVRLLTASRQEAA